MFDEKHYVPVIKWKRGERNALKALPQNQKIAFTPLIEIQPVPFDHSSGDFSKSLDDHLGSIGVQATDCLLGGHRAFVDVWTLYDNEDFDEATLMASGQHPVEFIIDQFESNGFPVVPVTGISRDQAFHAAINNVVSQYNRGVCIRLTKDDLLSVDELSSSLEEISNNLQLTKDQIDIVLDFKQLSGLTHLQFVGQLVMLLAQFPAISQWRTFTILATSMPANLSQIQRNTTGYIPRVEWVAFTSLRPLNLLRKPTFGDYTITHPDFTNIDPRRMTLGASIRYTSDTDFVIVKGERLQVRDGQMHNLCQILVAHPKYKGPTFSYGDEYIDNCASRNASPGNKETWVTVGVNHHLAQVVTDLSNLPVA